MNKEGVGFAIEKITYIEPASMQDMHYHDHYEILYVSQNERFLKIGNNEYTLSKDKIALIPPYIPHMTTAGAHSPEERILINFKGELLQGARALLRTDLLGAFDSRSPIIELGDAVCECREVIDSLLKLSEDKRRSSLKLCELLLLLREIRGEVASDEEFLEILKFIESNFKKKITLDTLSEKFYVNKFTLLRKFKKYTGMGLPKYLNTVRIINAKTALMKTDKIIDVAHFSGFGNVGSLDRAFIQEVGMTPREYRKKMLSQKASVI